MPTIIDILRLTPKTNCGKCGLPTCMAFAASLLSGQAAPDACPHLDKEALKTAGYTFQQSEARTDDPDTVLLRELQDKIVDVDLGARSEGLGAEVIRDENGQETLRFPYLGRRIVISRKAIQFENGGELDPRDQILLYNYVFFRGSGPLSGEWVGLESFPNSISKVVTLKKYTEDKIAQAFEASPDELRKRAEGIGGRVIEPCHADLCLEVPVLPKVPLQVHFWQADEDDGFPAKVKVLYDRRAIEFLDLESLVFTAERMTETMVEGR